MKNELLLGVNIDHIATLREARGTIYPDPINAAFIAEKSGADYITVHLREDERHIKPRDVDILCHTIETRLNLEMAITDSMLEKACQWQPSDVCLVPEKREELTTEGGLDVITYQDKISKFCKKLTQAGCQVSLFIDPEKEQLDAALKTGAPVVELHTGCYANASNKQQQTQEFRRIQQAAEYAATLGMQVNAGHGLHYHNVLPIAEIPQISELNIGHAIICRAVIDGIAKAIYDMKQLLIQARS